MKTIMFLFVCLVLIFSVASCKKQAYEKWSGNVSDLRIKEAACVVWVKQVPGNKDKFYAYKRFSDVNEMNRIIAGLTNPSLYMPTDLERAHEEHLLVFFLDGTNVLVGFVLDQQNKLFVGPLGKDNALYEIVTSKKVDAPYWGTFSVDPNVIKRSQEEIHEALKKAREANQPKYVELTKENFSKLDISKVVKIDVVTTNDSTDPTNWTGKYQNVFPIDDSIRISIIFKCIAEANSIQYYTDKKILFETKSVIYYLGIGYDDQYVFGDWWESKDLLKYFKEWGFEFPKGEPNLPKGQIWTHGLPPIEANLPASK